jgi:hypothetical protein
VKYVSDNELANMSHAPLEITLTWHQYGLALDVAGRMRLSAVARNHTDRYTGPDGLPTPVDTQVNGALGEIAAAKALNRFWGGLLNVGKAPDLPPDIEVRYNTPARGGQRIKDHLRVRPNDNPTYRYVCVVGEYPTFYVVGWLYGHEAQQEPYQTRLGLDRPPGFFVPPRHLHDPRELT